MINKIYDIQLSCCIVMTLMHEIDLLYYLFMDLQRPLHLFARLDVAVLCLIDISSIFLKICSTGYTCEYTIRQARKASRIIHAALSLQAGSDLRDEMFQFCLQISQTQQRKSRENSLWWNYKFICRCVSHVVSYLVISIQFVEMKRI
ncbi:uncharacterized protein LOC113464349 [Ceratina calcarata]|uniref:Uncharacterized protein LOC113464349 n=1 Tax=Ceratina calcarata TaxID=156304 RepID=A0AAJ7WAR3_9HYME|nr:uncharacterized protein LOC113464349 [Ceratina calcarata]